MSTTVRMRPTFEFDTDLSVSETRRCIRNSFSKAERTDLEVTQEKDIYIAKFAGDHAMISIVEGKRHFWSPWLQLEVRGAESGTQVMGRFSPHPSIWTGIMFTYFATAVVVTFAALFGVSQQLSGQSPWAYLLIPFGLFVATVLWLASKAGQNLAHDEMRQMKARVWECLSPHSDSPL